MTFVVERLAELRKHVGHLRDLRPRIDGVESLESDLSLHNDVLFSLLTVAQLVIDIAGELGARRGLGFEDYTHAVRNLASVGYPTDLVERLARLPGFRNVLLHEYIALDLEIAIRALDDLEPIERFVRLVADAEARDDA